MHDVREVVLKKKWYWLLGAVAALLAGILWYSFAGDSVKNARDAKPGELLWKRRVGANSHLATGPSDVVVSGNRVFCIGYGVWSPKGTLRALDTATGKKVWSTRDVLGRVYVIDGVGVFSQSEAGTKFDILDANTGKTLRSVDYGVGNPGGAITVAGDAVCVFGSDGCAVVDAKTNAEKWGRKGPLSWWPGTDGGAIFFCEGRGYALDSVSGNEMWSFTPKGPLSWASANEGTVLFYESNTIVHAVDSENGLEKWAVKTKACVGEARIAHGRAYVLDIGANAVHCLDLRDGSVVWTYPGGTGRHWGPLEVAGGALYVGCSDGNLYVIDTANGALKWRFTAGSGVNGPAVSADVAYFTAHDGYLYAVKAEPAGDAK